MIEREAIVKEFYITDHAVLYGLLAKYADELYGEAGMEAAAHATRHYAAQRGARMAKRAAADGRDLSLSTYRLYTEWEDVERRMKVETLQLSPNYRMNGTYCVWNETWKQYHLEKYGEIYCTYVDKTMVRSFNPQNQLIIHSAQSLGGAGCDFEWLGLSYRDEEAFREAGRQKRELRERTVKDFLYHCGHVVFAMGEGYAGKLGQEASDRIICLSMEEYGKLFGREKAEAVIRESERDFTEI